MAEIEKKRRAFRGLVANARDFLVQSLHSLEENPKISLIQFSTAVELFLKARLTLEHWSLIFENPGKADLAKFINGDLKSVNFQESLDRLNRIADAGISQQAIQCFEKLQSHRNRLVHFAHPAYSLPVTREARDAVVAEQLRAWYYLYQLFQTKWFSDFSEVMPLVRDLNRLMQKRTDYLQVKFSELAENIQKQRARGVSFSQCPSCRFTAFGRALKVGPLQMSICLVCEHSAQKILAHCPACGDENLLGGLGERVCLKCGNAITVDDLIGEHATPQSSDGNSFSKFAYCDKCEYTGTATVIPIGNGHVCLHCLCPHLGISQCAWCGEMVTGETGSYDSPGCVMCKHYIIDEAFNE